MATVLKKFREGDRIPDGAKFIHKEKVAVGSPRKETVGYDFGILWHTRHSVLIQDYEYVFWYEVTE